MIWEWDVNGNEIQQSWEWEWELLHGNGRERESKTDSRTPLVITTNWIASNLCRNSTEMLSNEFSDMFQWESVISSSLLYCYIMKI